MKFVLMQIIVKFNRKFSLETSIIFKEFGLIMVFRTWAERFCHKLGHSIHCGKITKTISIAKWNKIAFFRCVYAKYTCFWRKIPKYPTFSFSRGAWWWSKIAFYEYFAKIRFKKKEWKISLRFCRGACWLF